MESSLDLTTCPSSWLARGRSRTARTPLHHAMACDHSAFRPTPRLSSSRPSAMGLLLRPWLP
eukprot:3380561-Lingulodinium_polyedra.AAC.1